MPASPRVPRGVWPLAASGLIPFAVCDAIVLFGPAARHEQAVAVFVAYAALTLSFLGGIRWGAELVRAPDAPSLQQLALGAAPSLVAWLALWPGLDPRLALGIVLSGGMGQLAWDVIGGQQGRLPPWNATVRFAMTGGGVLLGLLLLTTFVRR